MPLRIAPTARQRRLGAELRKIREKAGLASSAGARQLGINQSRLSAIERGRYGVSERRVRSFAELYGYHDSSHINALAAMTVPNRRRWWDEYRDTISEDLLDVSELEHHATAIRTAQIAHLPGLLQTIDYARAVSRHVVPRLAPPELEYRVSHRIKRQQILFADEPTPYTATIHEAALRMLFGNPSVMREQLCFALEMSERPRITVRVVPFSAGGFPGSGESVVYAEGSEPRLDTVLVDTEHAPRQVFADDQLHRYRVFFDQFESMSLSPDASRDFLHAVIKTL